MLAVALWSTYLFAEQLNARKMLRALAMLVLVALCTGMVNARRITAAAEDNIYADEIIFARDTRYQHIVLTRFKDDLRLFLNSHLQFSSRDEYRYHEALVHPGLSAVPVPRRVWLLGGGDGLALREILKYPQIESITLVDLDPEMTRIFSYATHCSRRLNKGSFLNPEGARHQRRCVSLDRPDQGEFRFHRHRFSRPDELFARQAVYDDFLSGRRAAFEPAGFLVVQSTSPMFARDSFWCIAETLKQSGIEDLSVPRVCAVVRRMGIRAGGHARISASDIASLPELAFREYVRPFRRCSSFLPTCRRMPVAPNHLNDQVLVRMYDNDWKDISH